MAEEDKSFAELVATAPPAPAADLVSLVGALARSSEHGKFVLILQEGQTITLETAAVKGHAVLGASLGRTIVRVEVDAGKVPAIGPQPFIQATGAVQDTQSGTVRDINTHAVDHTGWHDIGTVPRADQKDPSLDQKDPYLDGGGFLAGGVAPFVLATPHQAPANVLDALNPFGIVSHRMKIPGSDTHAYRDYIDTGGGIDVIVLRTPL